MAGSIEGHCRVLSLADYQVSHAPSERLQMCGRHPSGVDGALQDAFYRHWCAQRGILLREAHERTAGLLFCITSACAGDCIFDLGIINLHGLLLQKLETVNNSDFFQRFSYDVRCTSRSFWHCRIQCLPWIACLFRLLSSCAPCHDCAVPCCSRPHIHTSQRWLQCEYRAAHTVLHIAIDAQIVSHTSAGAGIASVSFHTIQISP